MLSQKLPWLGKLRASSKIAQSEADVFKERFESTRLEVISKVKQAYFELYWITKAIAITRSNVDLMKQLEKVALVKYATGRVPQQDLLKAQVEISKLQNDLDTFTEMRTTAESKLNALLGRPPAAPLGAPEEIEFERLTLDLDSLYRMARESSPDLRLHQRRIEKAEREVGLAKLDYYPDFTLGVQYQDIGSGAPMAPNEGRDAWSAKFSINLPLWWGKRQAGVNEAKTRAVSEQFA
ncbi:MAG: TolC family protein, partial [Armatimonadetes bacterium]|nr:TolC family protein [Armatimonadota bacterium]NIO96038.1 TolC family protein [Armatimonadota bacterium]